MPKTLDAWIRALLFIRLGQELGTDSRLARAVHDLVDLLVAVRL